MEEKDAKPQRKVETLKHYKGYLFGIASGTAASGQQLIAEAISIRGYSTPQMLTMVYGISLFCCIVQVALQKKSFLPKSDWKYVVSYCLLICIGQMTKYSTLTWIPIGTIMAIYYGTLTVFCVVFAKLFLKESVSGLGCLFLCGITVGLFLCCKNFIEFRSNSSGGPFFKSIAAVIVIAGGFLHAIGSCCVRRIMFTDAATVCLYSSFLGGIVSGVIMACTRPFTVPTDPTDYLLITLLCSANFISRFVWIYGLQISNTADVVIGSQVDISLCFLFSYILYGKVPGVASVTGATDITIFIILFTLKDVIDAKLKFYLHSWKHDCQSDYQKIENQV